MPYIIQGETQSISVNDFRGVDKYSYKYPEGLDWSPSGRLHRDTLSRLLRYGLESSNIVSQNHETFRKMDEKLTAYIPPSLKEQRIQEQDSRKPISIVFPYSYAILETLVSYLIAAFTVDPLFRYEGNGPEDIMGAFLLEKVIGLQCIRNKVALNLHTMFRDCAAYGFGVVSPQWTVKRGTRIVNEPTFGFDDGGARVRTGRRKTVRENVTLFEGNSLVNIDPYCYLPDPNVSIHSVQDGEYVGWLDSTNLLDLIEEEEIQDPNDIELFNIKYLRHMTGKTSVLLSNGRRQKARGTTYTDSNQYRMVSEPVDRMHMYVKLIPKQWKLGSSNVPEKWLFTVAADSVIIRAQPLNLYHNMFPVAIAAPDFDGYSPVTYSRLNILSGMQTTIDWLFNSHIANVRKALNDVLIVDPYMININDLKDPGPGGIVRLRRPAWGKGVKDAVYQLNIVDITRQNIGDVSAIIQYMQAIGGTDNPVMGNLRQGGPERLSAREFQGTAQGAVNRLERVAKVIGLQAMQDIGYMFAYHAQQLMEESVYVRSSGDWPQEIASQINPQNDRVLVTPADVAVDYDLLVRDGSIPGGNFSESWVQMFQTIGNSELLSQQFDIVRIFEYIATQLGAKNVGDFRLRPVQPKVLPDEQVAQQLQAGNLVPLEQGV